MEFAAREVRKDRVAGGLQGLLIGDALGVPYEFHDAIDHRLEVLTIPWAVQSLRFHVHISHTKALRSLCLHCALRVNLCSR
jgi:hypothetical protein